MRVLAIGKSRAVPEMAIFERYAARIKPRLTLVEFNDGVGSSIEIKKREAETLLAALAPGDFVITLDAGGKTPDSMEFAKMLNTWRETGKKLNFIIGGAEGLDGAVIVRADACLSFGAFTWPHMLVRPMLAEQIYRAQMINSGHPYHRAGRP